MNPAIAIAFATIFFLGPIPAWHLILHAFLPAWKRSPRAYYLLAAIVWALFGPLSWILARRSPLLFEPAREVRVLGLGVSGVAFLVALWSMATLSPRRFFMWAALRPDLSPPERILRGPYRFTAHPTYVAIVAATLSNFLASGSALLLGAVPAMALLLAVVSVLEQRELTERLGAPFPERERTTSPLTPSPRD
jgi:protein-S-isoprenylcysteine O-methyltransferase Ste14